MANRGAQQFSEIVEQWKKMARLNLEFSSNEKDMIKYFI
jgi:hypothetical protein